MNETEIKNLLTLAIGAFPFMQDKDMRPTTMIWAKVLADIPYEIAEGALVRTLSTAKVFPTLAEIREATVMNTKSKTLTTGEAYQEVLKAISKFGGQREREAMESLSPLTRQAVKSVGWDSLCYSRKYIVRAQFVRAYEKLEKYEAIEARVPQSLKLEIV